MQRTEENHALSERKVRVKHRILMRIYEVKIKESGLSSRFNLAEESIRELEVKFIEIIRCGEQKGKKTKIEHNLRKL